MIKELQKTVDAVVVPNFIIILSVLVEVKAV